MEIYSIYKITNIINNKSYIGWTSRDVNIRIKEHLYKNKTKNRSPISFASEKYGAENFIHSIIYQSKDYEHSREIETHFIIEHNTLVDTIGGYGYNIDLGGKGHKRSPETIEKHRQKLLGRKQTQEHIDKRKMIGEKNPMYEKGQFGEKNGMFGKKPHNFGKQMSEETRQKLSDSLIGKNKDNISASKKYKITFPDGSIKDITNLKNFCEDHNLVYGVFMRYHKLNIPYRNFTYIKID